MPVSVVVGGQYGSEGKGKVALQIVRRDPTITIAVRPGGTNSGHTAYNLEGRKFVLRQLPAAAIDKNVTVVLPAGSYVDVELLLHEMEQLGLESSKLLVDPKAHVIHREHLEWESEVGLASTIGSTGSGTGAAVLARLSRGSGTFPPSIPAARSSKLKGFLANTQDFMHKALAKNERVLIEGTQGYGLSPLHGEHWPHCTSRDTTAAAFVSEAGLSPLSVDEIVMVLRCHPIRVAGRSGPLESETSWEDLQHSSGACSDLTEYSSVTKRVRRVGHFELAVVAKALIANAPTKLVLNHLDYVDWQCRSGSLTPASRNFVAQVEEALGRKIDWLGVSEDRLIEREAGGERARAA